MFNILLFLISFTYTIAFSELNNSLNQDSTSININGYAAIVNKEIITNSDVQKTILPILPSLYRQYKGEELKNKISNLYQESLINLINQELIFLEFKQQGGQIPDSIVEDEINSLKKTTFKNNDINFENYLINEQKTYEEYFEEIRKKIAIRALISQNINSKLDVSPKIIYNYYNDNIVEFSNPKKIKYLTLELNSCTNAMEQNIQITKAKESINNLKNVHDINKIKKVIANDTNLKINEFSWIKITDISKDHLEILNKLNTNEFSDIIELYGDYFIFYIEEQIEASSIPFDEVKNSIKNKIQNNQKEAYFQEWINELRNKTYVKIF